MHQGVRTKSQTKNKIVSTKAKKEGPKRDSKRGRIKGKKLGLITNKVGLKNKEV